jgi:GTPase SAR1 family protein
VSQGNVHFLVPGVPNSLFTGRDHVLGELKNTIMKTIENSSNDLNLRIVISGMGGLGKSEICLQLAHNLRKM